MFNSDKKNPYAGLPSIRIASVGGTPIDGASTIDVNGDNSVPGSDRFSALDADNRVDHTGVDVNQNVTPENQPTSTVEPTATPAQEPESNQEPKFVSLIADILAGKHGKDLAKLDSLTDEIFKEAQDLGVMEQYEPLLEKLLNCQALIAKEKLEAL